MRGPRKGNPLLSEALAGRDRQGARRGEPSGFSVSPTEFQTLHAERGSHASDGDRAPPSAPHRRRLRLPCLSSNNSTDPRSSRPRLGVAATLESLRALSQQHRKSACALAWNVQALADRHGIEKIGFLTLTFREHITCAREAQRRFNSLATHVLRQRYPEGFVRVVERMKSGRIHYHLLVVLANDIRTGFDFDAIRVHDYRTASPALRSEWAFWRSTASAYGFGRTELLPVRSTSEGIARYVGKYISKHIAKREERDRGIRLVEYSRGARMCRTRFSWASENAASWRRKLALFAQIVSANNGGLVVRYEDLKTVLGTTWAYRHREFIAALPDLRRST